MGNGSMGDGSMGYDSTLNFDQLSTVHYPPPTNHFLRTMSLHRPDRMPGRKVAL
jgi:hypothetical protein